MNELTIYAYGSGTFIAQVLEAVKDFTSGGIAVGMFKVFVIVALLYGLSTAGLKILRPELTAGDTSESSMAPFVILLRNIFIAAIGTWFFFNPVATRTVIVEDRFDPTQSRVVENVPLGIAFTGYVSSVVGDRIGEKVETWLSPVDAVKSRLGGGVGIGPKYVNQLFDLMPPGAPTEYGGNTNVPIRGVLEAWISQCIYPNFAVIDGEGTRAEGLREFATTDFILLSPVLNSPPFSDPNTPLSVQFYKTGPERTTCRSAPNQILTRWLSGEVMEPWIARFSASVFGVKEDNPQIVTRIYDIVDHYFPSADLGTHDKLIQLATINTAYSAYMKLLSEYSAAGAFDIARRRQAAGWVEAAKLGARVLPVVRQISEAGVYLFGAFLPVFVAACGLAALFKYIRFVFWLGLWIPIFAVLNAIADYHMVKAVESVSQCVAGTCSLVLNFETVDKLRTESGTILGYIGLLSLSAPGIAWGILRGADSLGGMVGSVLATREAASVGAASATERTAALTHYTAGTMLGSAYTAGIGQARTVGEVQGVRDYGNLGAVQTLASLQMGESLKYRSPLLQGLVQAAQSVGEGPLQQAGARQVYDTAGGALGFFDVAHRAFSIASGGTATYLDTAKALASGMKVTPLVGRDGAVEGAVLGFPNANVLVSFGEGSPVVTWSGLPVTSNISKALTYSHAGGIVSQNRAAMDYSKEKVKSIFSGETQKVSTETAKTFLQSYASALGNAVEQSEDLRENKELRDAIENFSKMTIKGKFELPKIAKILSPLGISLGYEGGRAGRMESSETVGHGIVLSDKQKQAFEKAHREALESATRYTLSTESGFQDLSKLARSEGASEAKVFDEAHRGGEEWARRFSEDATSGFVNEYMQRKYGNLPWMEQIVKTTQDLKRMEARGDYSEFWETIGVKPGNFGEFRAFVEQHVNRGAGEIKAGILELKKDTAVIKEKPDTVKKPRELSGGNLQRKSEASARSDLSAKQKKIAEAVERFYSKKEDFDGFVAAAKGFLAFAWKPNVKLNLKDAKVLQPGEE